MSLFKKSYTLQNTIINLIIIFSYIIYITGYIGVTIISPNNIHYVQNIAKVYIALFLIIRFNPFTNSNFTELDRKIVYNAGIFLLATTTFQNITKKYLTELYTYLRNL